MYTLHPRFDEASPAWEPSPRRGALFGTPESPNISSDTKRHFRINNVCAHSTGARFLNPVLVSKGQAQLAGHCDSFGAVAMDERAAAANGCEICNISEAQEPHAHLFYLERNPSPRALIRRLRAASGDDRNALDAGTAGCAPFGLGPSGRRHSHSHYLHAFSNLDSERHISNSFTLGTRPGTLSGVSKDTGTPPHSAVAQRSPVGARCGGLSDEFLKTLHLII